jgi:hypothetical protein
MSATFSLINNCFWLNFTKCYRQNSQKNRFMKIRTAVFLFLPLTIWAYVKESVDIRNGIGKENIRKIHANGMIHYPSGSFEIVIHEIMADPDPPVSLPVVEYIELMNASDRDIASMGWKLSIGEKTVLLPPFLIENHACLIVCDAADSNLMKPYGAVLPVVSFPALKNEGQTLTLINEANDIVHSVSYSSSWYGNSLKSEGGWSLEMIDPENPCGQKENWSASEHYLGGTPGFKNSINRYNPDNSRPFLLRAATTSDSGLLVSFSEPLDITSTSYPFNYTVNRNVFHPYMAEPLPPDFASVQLTFPVKFSTSLVYELMVKDSVCDCAGNGLNDSYAEFGLSYFPDSFGLIINELLFDAHEGEEFVEIFNRSDRIIELSSLTLALMDEYTGAFTRKLHQYNSNFQLLPGEYTVITGSAADLQKYYTCKDPAAVIEADEPLNLPDQAGVLVLISNSATLIDCFFYDANLHLEMITDPEGVSLERLFADYATNNPDNWHSAAENAGFATPGYLNSQSILPDDSPVSSVWSEPEVFTPDNDGSDDLLAIFYHLDEPGSLANIMIFDSRGKLVRRLANNNLLGTEGCITWDGTNTEGALEKTGIYVIYSEILSENGKVRKYTHTCVLSKEIP